MPAAPAPRSAGPAAAHGRKTASQATACTCGGGCPRCAPALSTWSIGERDDPTERQADAWAQQWARAPAPPLSGAADGPAALAERRKSYRPLDASVTALSTVIGSSGEAIPPGIRGRYEPALAVDLSPVRLHRGEAAAAAARAADATAFALGRDIVFGADAPPTHSLAGQRLLAHELAHLAQPQAAQPVLRRSGTAAAPAAAAPEEVPFPDQDELDAEFAGLYNGNWDNLKGAWRLLDQDLAASREKLALIRWLLPSSLSMLQESQPSSEEAERWRLLQQAIDLIDVFQSTWTSAGDVRRDEVETLYRQAADALLEIERQRPPLLESFAEFDDPLLAAYARVFPHDPLPDSLALAHRTRLAIKLSETRIDESVRDAAIEAISNPATWAMLLVSVGVYVAAWLIPSGVTQLAAAGLTFFLLAMFIENDLVGFAAAWLEFMRGCDDATTEDELRDAGTGFVQASGGPVVDVMLMAMFWLSGKAAGPKLAARKNALESTARRALLPGPPPEPGPAPTRLLILDDGYLLIDAQSRVDLARFDLDMNLLGGEPGLLLDAMRRDALPPQVLEALTRPATAPAAGEPATRAAGAPSPRSSAAPPPARAAAPAPSPTPEANEPPLETATTDANAVTVEEMLNEVVSPQLPVRAGPAAVGESALASAEGKPESGTPGGLPPAAATPTAGTLNPADRAAPPAAPATSTRGTGSGTAGGGPLPLAANLGRLDRPKSNVRQGADPEALRAATALAEPAASSPLQDLVGATAADPTAPIAPADALALLSQAYPQLRIVLDPDPVLRGTSRAQVTFLTLNGTQRVVVFGAQAGLTRVTLAHEALHIEDFALGRVNAYADYPVPGEPDDTELIRLGQLDRQNLPEWDLINSQVLEIVNYARDAIRWVDYPAELEATDPYQNIVFYATQLDGHFTAVVREQSFWGDALDAYFLSVQRQLQASWGDAGLRAMLDQLQRWNRGYYQLRRALPRLPWFSRLMGELLPEDLRSPAP